MLMTAQLRRLATMAAAVSVLAACGEQKTSERIFEKAGSEECAGAVIQGRYMVRYTDGRMATVNATSDKEFLDGYVTRNLASIEYAEPDYRVQVKAGQLNVMAGPGVADNWGVERVHVEALWAQGLRGQGIAVAVVDSGMDLAHPQLAKRVYTNPGEQGVDSLGRDRMTNGIDDDGNGLIDDAIGYDFAADRPLRGDYQHHGTHVAGIIVAEHPDTEAGPQPYVQGVAPEAKVLPLAFLDETGSGSMSNGVRAIEYAVVRGARVINASWGGPMCSRSLRDTISRLEGRGVIFLAAAGNDRSDVDRFKEYPASLNLAAQITVGATGEADFMAEYSNYGAQAVHIFAPGTSIISTIPGNRMGSLSGTSMATPFVAGAVALLLGAEPTAQARQIRQALYNSAVKRSDYINASRGRMDLSIALSELRRIMGK